MDATMAITLSTVVTLLMPYLKKAGEKVAEEVGKDLYSLLKKKFSKQPASDKVLKNLKKNPDDLATQNEFKSQLDKFLKDDNYFQQQVMDIVSKHAPDAQQTMINSGDGAIGTDGGVSAGKGGVAVGGDVSGNITIGK